MTREEKLETEFIGVIMENCVVGDYVWYNPKNGHIKKMTNEEANRNIKIKQITICPK
jgi:hypothetical protein